MISLLRCGRVYRPAHRCRVGTGAEPDGSAVGPRPLRRRSRDYGRRPADRRRRAPHGPRPIVAVGKRGAVPLPPGGTRVSLTGKTVMPALIDTHVHLGYQKGLSFAAENFTRETLVDQLNRYASSGVGVVVSLGTDPGDLPVSVARRTGGGAVGRRALPQRGARHRRAECWSGHAGAEGVGLRCHDRRRSTESGS